MHLYIFLIRGGRGCNHTIKIQSGVLGDKTLSSYILYTVT